MVLVVGVGNAARAEAGDEASRRSFDERQVAGQPARAVPAKLTTPVSPRAPPEQLMKLAEQRLRKANLLYSAQRDTDLAPI